MIGKEKEELLKRAFSEIMFILLLMGMLTLAFNIQPVRASGTIYIRADGSVDPSTAPISTTDNVTYTLTDNIIVDGGANGIVIVRDNIVIDGNGFMLQGSVTGNGIDLSERENVTVRNIQIKSFGHGIWLGSSNYNSIIGSNVTANSWAGIYLNSSSNNSIIGNNGGDIALVLSSNNSIIGNNITKQL